MVAKFFENLTIRHKILMLVFLGVVLLAGLVATAFYNLSPILISMAEERARQLAVAALNQAISEVMDRKVSYSDLVTIVSDNQGRISMIQANTMLMNALASEAALEAQKGGTENG